ncbi:MAG: SBBP repeat-containing protein [Pseudomonadota bacterium]
MNTRQTRTLRTLGLGLIAASAAGFCLTRTASAEREPAAAAARALDASTRLGPTQSASRNPATLRFERNQGQFQAEVRYAAHGKGYGFYLTRRGATLLLSRSKSTPSARVNAPRVPAELEQAIIAMRVVGARAVEPVGHTALPGASNYFVGSDSSRWKSGIESFASVVYEQILPGISLVYYGTKGRELEYDFVLDPGSNAHSIELEFEGIDELDISPDGSALLKLPGGDELRKAPPVAYQTNAAGERVAVASSYELRAGSRLGFRLGDYDRTRALCVDPVLIYSTYMGSSAYDEAFGVASDAAGNSYIAGYTASNLFTLVAPFQAASGGGGSDAFIAKFDASGSVVYSTYLGGSGADVAYAVAADVAGNAYVTGVTFSTNFPTASPLQAAAGGKQDAFVAKFNAQGSALSYSSYLGGSQDDYGQGIAVGSTGGVFVVGVTFSSNFPRLAALQASLNGTSDAFVSALTPSGSSFTYSTFLGGSASENGHAIAVDASGNAYVAGATASNNFPSRHHFKPCSQVATSMVS